MKDIVDDIKLKLSIQAHYNVFPFINDPNLSFCYFTFNNNPEISTFFLDSIEWPENIKNSLNKRKLEFLLGRCCAYEALFNLGNNADFLARTKDGVPIWPDGFVGSISHTHGEILALATNQQHYLAVGIDIEKIICEQDAFGLINLVLNSDEKKLILGMDVQEMLIVITLIFSAKESFYKLINKASEIVLDFNV
ncbi:4'-phosphopantetheinyl transferase family protein, partial [Gilliamella sp. Fer4-1]|uniref:4'-phosphopantetheinyl transferase family protein n=1 Tax=Gilliamella sp. Fer4-1 TaxID=3120242 RepID=UPI00080DD1CF